MNKTVHRYEQKRLEKCVTVGFSVKSRKERSFMSDSAILRSGFVTAWPVGEESDTGREFSIRLTPSSRFSLSLSLSLPFHSRRTMPDPYYARSFRRCVATREPGQSSLFRLEISRYDLPRWIDYLLCSRCRTGEGVKVRPTDPYVISEEPFSVAS